MPVKKSRKRKVIITVSILLVAGGLAAHFLLPKNDARRVVVARVEEMERLESVVNGSGEIRTENSVDIQTEIAGVIIELEVREGDPVKKGQILLKIDPFQTESDVEAARSQLSALEAEAAGQAFQIASAEANAARDEYLRKSGEVELRQAQVNLARSRESFNRSKRLLEAKLIPPDQYEVADTEYQLKQAQVEAARAGIDRLDAQIKAARASIEYARASRDALLRRVEGARSNLERAEDLLKKTTIRSPLDGVVVKLNVEVGERAVPGILSNPQATLMTIADLSVIEAELKIDETDIVNVELEHMGKIEVDALPNQELRGRVIEIGNSPITTYSSEQEGKDFKVVLRIENPPGSLRPGMSCEADITTKVRNKVKVIPIQALTMREVRVGADGKYIPGPLEKNKGDGFTAAASAQSPPERRKELEGVFVPGEDGRARFRPVKTGITGEMDIEILEGLEIGEEVVVGPLKALRNLEENEPVFVDRSKPYRRFSRKRGGYLDKSGDDS